MKPIVTTRAPGKTEEAIIRTVCYSAIFDYPLTFEELHRGLIDQSAEPEAVASLCQTSAALRAVTETRDELVFLQGRGHLVGLRAARRKQSLRLLRANRTMLRVLCALPFVRMVAISGSAAHLNLEQDGDIDLFIVTRGARVWTVAVMMLCLVKAAGRRRTICFNFLLSDERLKLAQTDLFTANQIASLKVIVGQDVAGELLAQNPFVGDAYPNLTGLQSAPVDCRPGRLLSALQRVVEVALRPGPAQVAEWVCRRLYGRHLRRRRHAWTSPEEVVMELDVLKLHSHSHRDAVASRYRDLLDWARERTGELE